MHCPECSHRVPPFRSWTLWPIPSQNCPTCGTLLRWSRARLWILFFAILSPFLLILPFRLTAHVPLAIGSFVAITVLLLVASFLLPAFFDQYTKRCPKSPLRDFGFAIAASITPFALYGAIIRWEGSRALADALSCLEQKHEPIRIEDLQRPPLPDDQNIAAAPIFKEMGATPDQSRLNALNTLPLLKKNPPPLQDPNRWQTFAKSLDPQFSGSEPEAHAWLLQKLEEHQPLLTEITEALKRPQAQWPADFSKGFAAPIKHINGNLNAAKLLRLRAKLYLASEKPSEALEDCLALLRLTRASQQGYYLIEGLVFCTLLNMTRDLVEEALPGSPWSPDQWLLLANGLDQIQSIEVIIQGLRTERILQQNQWFYEAWAKDPSQPNRSAFRALIPALIPTGWIRQDQAACALRQQRLIDDLLSPQTLPKTLAEITAQTEGRSLWDLVRYPASHVLFSALASCCQTAVAAETLARCTATACRLAAQLPKNASLPQSAAELSALLGQPLPKDPLSGNPIIYRAEGAHSFALYGVGWNGTDEGGQDLFNPSIKLGSLSKSKDWGIRVQFQNAQNPPR